MGDVIGQLIDTGRAILDAMPDATAAERREWEGDRHPEQRVRMSDPNPTNGAQTSDTPSPEAAL